MIDAAVVAASDDLAFVDRVLESWAAWSRNAGLPLVSHPSARYSTGHDRLRSVLMLTDAEFGKVDRVVAKLDTPAKAIVWLNYCRDEGETKRRKAERAGITVRMYDASLLAAQLEVHTGLRPDVYNWQTLAR